MHTMVRLVSTLGVLLVVGAASASDGKHYTGTQCLPLFGSSVSYDSFGRVENPSGQNSFVICPAIKDQSGNLASGFLRVLDQNFVANEDVVCEIHATTTSQNLISSRVAVARTTGFNSNLQTLSIPAGFGDASSTLHFNCTIPRDVGAGRSGILMYHMEEN